jgi:UPF0755 protein
MRHIKHVKRNNSRLWPRRVVYSVLTLLLLFVLGAGAAHFVYNRNLKALQAPGAANKHFIVKSGDTVSLISTNLYNQKLIRSAWAFHLYVDTKGLRSNLQAGTYTLTASDSTPTIVAKMVNGKVTSDLVTVLPAQRLDQITTSFVKAGFSSQAVAAALNPTLYTASPALADKPATASLEGFLYPDSYQKDASTTAETIVGESIKEMEQQLTPDVRASFANKGLSVFQGVTMASIVEQEVSKPSDRAQVAQVFLTRMQNGMMLGSDVTAYYGARINGQKPSVGYDSPYNTLLHKGLPPGPISNVSGNSLQAVAHPANTDWLYFVSGDNGNTYFSKTLEDHQALTAQYCHKLCSATP